MESKYVKTNTYSLKSYNLYLENLMEYSLCLCKSKYLLEFRCLQSDPDIIRCDMWIENIENKNSWSNDILLFLAKERDNKIDSILN